MKKENIVFVQDLGLSSNILDINGLFEKIKKKEKCKTKNSYLLVSNPKKEDIVDIKEANSTAIRIPIVSYISKSLNKKITLMANAIKSILIIGSAKDSKNNLKKLFFLI